MSEYKTPAQMYRELVNRPKDASGNPIVAPTFEDDAGLTGRWRGEKYTATKNTLNIFDRLVTSQIKLRGGWYELLDDPNSPTAVLNDYIEFAVVDKDDVLGLFSTYGLTPRAKEVQEVIFSATPTAGTYTLTHSGDTTSAINWDADAATVKTALEALTSIGAGGIDTVTGDNTDRFVVTFSDYADHPEMTSNDASLTGATLSHATTAAGAVGDFLELDKYVVTDYVNPYSNQRQGFQVPGAADVVAGLFLRTYYNSIGTVNDVSFKVVVWAHET